LNIETASAGEMQAEVVTARIHSTHQHLHTP